MITGLKQPVPITQQFNDTHPLPMVINKLGLGNSTEVVS
jgi:hypothetical protein